MGDHLEGKLLVESRRGGSCRTEQVLEVGERSVGLAMGQVGEEGRGWGGGCRGGRGGDGVLSEGGRVLGVERTEGRAGWVGGGERVTGGGFRGLEMGSCIGEGGV